MHDIESLRAHAERIRASGVLGRSRLTQRLFDFLLDCTVTGRAPKEIEVAIDVFGKDENFDVSQDAMVRVYIHKLRRKLDDYYEGPGREETVRITIPKGAYRFTLEQPESAPAPPPVTHETPPAEHRISRRPWIIAAVVALLTLNALALIYGYVRVNAPADQLDPIRNTPVWSPLLEDERTIFIVLGDYYIFGESDGMGIQRLVREFHINSSGDLAQYLKRNPELADRYLDLQLEYLPTSAAFALRDVLPVLAPANRRVRIALMSDLNPVVFKSAHVIYIGYLSGMGMLQDLVFAGSRYSVGATYDELIDLSTETHYVSQAGTPLHDESKYHDYGYFATFTGPTGNRVMIIAGMRDVAVMNTAEALTNRRTLEELISRAGDAQAFEALYEVYGMDRMNLDGKLLSLSKLDTGSIWSGERYEAGNTAQVLQEQTP